MSLLDLQRVLTRLYTDSAFRAAFFHDPTVVGRETGLTAGEQRQLAALDRHQVERFARSLKQKRLGLVRELLPATAGVLGEAFAPCFFDYCDRQPSARERVEEATAFIDHLLCAPPRRGEAPEWPDYGRDLLACERLHLELLAPPAKAASPWLPSSAEAVTPEAALDRYPQRTDRTRVAAFAYDLEALYPKAARGERSEARPDRCFLLIVRPPHAPRARMKRINAPSAQLLTLCNGTRKLADILDAVAAALRLTTDDRPAFAAECMRFLAPLAANDLIRWLSEPATASQPIHREP